MQGKGCTRKEFKRNKNFKGLLFQELAHILGILTPLVYK